MSTSPLVCQFRQASGRAFNDCVILGRRFPDSIGPVATESDFWILINEPRPAGTVTHAFWSFRSFVTGIWQAPSGTVYATDADMGGLYVFEEILNTDRRPDRVKLDDVTPEGVWGLTDDNIFVWGTRMDEDRVKTYPVFRFDGSGWTELPPLPQPTNRIHGASPETVYACGWRGMIARWSGNDWEPMETPTREIVTDIHVESDDEVYAVTNDGQLLQGSSSGWRHVASNPLGATPFSGVAKFRGQLLVSANELGLMRLVAETGALEVFKAKVTGVHMEARENLIVTCEHIIAGTADGQDFKGAAKNQLALLTADKPIAPL